MNVRADLPVEPVRRVLAADSRTPILLTGLSAAAVLGASGDLSLIRETRGADMDWGGVYGEGVRLTGAWWVRFGDPQGTHRTLSESMVHLESFRTRVESHHEAAPFHCDQEIVALAELPGVGRRLTFSNPTNAATALWVEATFRPELAPVLIEGIKPFDYHVLRTPTGLQIIAFGSALEFASTGRNAAYQLNEQPWDGRPYRGALDTVSLRSTMTLPPVQSSTVSYLIWGGMEATVRTHPERTAQLLGSAGQWAAVADASRRDWTARAPRLRFPSAPELERGYLLARDALRSLYFTPEPGIVGLVAGYPWYAALWCRDLAWMLPAVLWLGDAPWVANSLRSVFRFQARVPLPILGGAAGELPMQIGPGPVFLYGTSDTTLHYPVLLRRYLDHSGDVSLVRELAHPVQLTEQWARGKTNLSTGLIRNGDEDAGLRLASQEFGRVHYGFDAYDTTIWDSTDRRSHAVDIQVLWADALTALGELAPVMGLDAQGPRWTGEAQKLRQTVALRYWWAAENYLYDSLAEDGTPVQKIRPNALLAVARGLLPRDRAVAVVERASRADLATEWGYRTLSSTDPTYNPISYHDGQVWPIASAWAVGAAFAVGQTQRAVDGLRRWAERLDQEAGTLNECYRGDRAEPFDSCFLLGFSVAPFLTLLFDDLWGLRPQARDRTLSVEPHFPVSWSQASIEGLALFGGAVTLTWDRPRMTVTWRGNGSLRVQGGTHQLELADGGSGTLEYATPADPS
ncbi:MAG: amylo-alpha-1,6-glucosidase [Thermoplasmata archaeon]